jgi:hypothetical protein
METIKKQLKLGEQKYYQKHLEIINNFLPVTITPKEIEVLSNFMILKGDISNDRFGTSARKMVMNKMNLSVAGISNYIKVLKQKGFINDEYKILNILYPEPDKQSYNFKIENYDSI